MKKIIILLLVSLTIFTFSCKKKDDNIEKKEESKTLYGEYIISSANFDGTDILEDFTIYKINFNVDLTMEVNIYKDGYLVKRNSTYEYFGSVIKEFYNDEVFTYTVTGETLFTTYDDLGDEIEITLKKKDDFDKMSEVDFNSLLFGEDVKLTKKYNYCPAIIYDTEDGKTIMHVWYCTNKDSGVIMDYIGYRKGTLLDNGKWKFSDEVIAMSPTADTWDARHTCDPSVVKGEFKLKDETYYYLMAYLGCTTEDYQKNETGIAVSKTPYGPWVKIDSVNPIVPWYDDGNIDTEETKYQSYKGTSTIYWGTGMPSLVSVDEKGEVLLFYSSTKRGVGLRRIDLSDLENPIVKYTVSISGNSILNSTGANGRIAIPDFAFDKENHRFYVTGVTNEKNPPDVTLTRVNSHSFVAYLDNVNSMEEVSTILQNGSYSWKMLGFIGPNETGWERNHNPGIVKDEHGYIVDSSKIQVIVSTGHNSWNTENIFTYRLYGWTFEVK